MGASPYSLSFTDEGKLCLKSASGACFWWFSVPDAMEELSSAQRTALATVAGYPTLLSDGLSSLLLMGDGNLVFSAGSSTLWTSSTKGLQPGPYVLALGRTGDLVLSSRANGKALWRSNTGGKGTGPYRLVVKSRKVQLLDSTGAAIWSK